VTLFCTSLLVDLIPPPLLTHVTPASLDSAAEQAEAWLPESKSAQAAELESPAAAPLLQPSAINGSVFRDYDADGTRDAGEPLLTGITGMMVIAYDDNNNSVGSANVITSTGQYALSASGTGPFRLEFTGLPSWLQPGAAGADSGTAVQFINGAGTVDFSVNNPADYCDPDPSLVTSCFLFNAAGSSFVSGDASIVRFQRSDADYTGANGIGTGIGSGDNEYLASIPQTGSVMGLHLDLGRAMMARIVPLLQLIRDRLRPLVGTVTHVPGI